MTSQTTDHVNDDSVAVSIEGSARAALVFGYGCPTDPDQCTCDLSTIRADATAGTGVSVRAGTSLAAETTLSCHVSVTLSTSAPISGDITVTIAAGNQNVSLSGNTSRVISNLQPNAPQVVTFLFTFIPATGIGLLDISISHAGQSVSMPQMKVTVS